MFKDLEFDPLFHEYSVNGTILDSVSKTLSNFVPEFNSNIAYGVAKKNKVPVSQILDQWQRKKEDAAVLGSRTHKFAENYILHKFLQPSNEFEKGVKLFLDSLPKHYEIVHTELQMYNLKLRMGGTLDLLIRNKKTNKYIIFDYKTNEDIYKNYKGQKLKKPFGNMLNHSFNKFQIQLSYYRIFLEEVGLQVENTFIIWLTESSELGYKIIKCKDYSKKLLNYHANRRNNSNS